MRPHRILRFTSKNTTEQTMKARRLSELNEYELREYWLKQAQSDEMFQAANSGDLAAIKKLRSQGADWSCLGGSICVPAARSGHLHVLKWARANGCPWSKEECLRVSACHDDVNNWIINGDAKKTRDTDEVRELRKQVADLTRLVASLAADKGRNRRPRKP
jgi:hypothetical protein